jgi:hypothetical protein
MVVMADSDGTIVLNCFVLGDNPNRDDFDINVSPKSSVTDFVLKVKKEYKQLRGVELGTIYPYSIECPINDLQNFNFAQVLSERHPWRGAVKVKSYLQGRILEEDHIHVLIRRAVPS